jgi:hypothetical protein
MARVWIVALMSVATGCDVAPPTGVDMTDDRTMRAVDAAMEFFSTRPRSVVGVPWNCTEETPAGTGYGWRRPGDGACVSSLEKNGVVYLMLHPDVRYSHMLCHEMAHANFGDGDHRYDSVWSTLVPECNRRLAETLGEDDAVMRD